jgi:hypothetical protein
MSKANKQRMRMRLIDAICRHDPDLAFERAVMGNEFRLMRMTHKQLKLMLRLGANYSKVTNTYAAIDGIMVKHYGGEQCALRKLRHIEDVTVSV